MAFLPIEPDGVFGKMSAAPQGADCAAPGSGRLDALWPADEATGACSPAAFLTALGAFMDMLGRKGLGLTLLAVAANPREEIRDLPAGLAPGPRGLIGRAVARNILQETRIYDVVGRCPAENEETSPTFLVACPLISEEEAAQLAERLRASMTTAAASSDQSWLSISVGVAAMSLDTAAPSDLVARAVACLRSARRQSEGGVWRHSDTRRRIARNNEPDSPDERG